MPHPHSSAWKHTCRGEWGHSRRARGEQWALVGPGAAGHLRPQQVHANQPAPQSIHDIDPRGYPRSSGLGHTAEPLRTPGRLDICVHFTEVLRLAGVKLRGDGARRPGQWPQAMQGQESCWVAWARAAGGDREKAGHSHTFKPAGLQTPGPPGAAHSGLDKAGGHSNHQEGG